MIRFVADTEESKKYVTSTPAKSPSTQVRFVATTEESKKYIPSSVEETRKANASDTYNNVKSMLEEKRRQAQVDMDVDTINDIDARLKRLRADAGKQTVADRIGDTVGASASGTVGNVANAAGTLIDIFNGKNNSANKIYDFADTAAQDTQRFTQNAKEGLGKLGQFAVDAGVAGGQLLTDMAASALLPGAGLALMGARGFGGGAQEARQSGATLGQQVAYGAGTAATSVLAEKLFNVAGPYAKTFGKGFFDKVASKLTSSAVGRVVASALTEGAEEGLESILQPMLKNLTYTDGEKVDWSEVAYESLIGAALGGLGGTINTNAQADTRNSAKESPATQIAKNEGGNAPKTNVAQKASESDSVEVKRELPKFNNELVQTAIDAQSENGRATNKVVEAISKNADALAELNVNPSGKTASQIRAEIRQAIESSFNTVVDRSVNSDTLTEGSDGVGAANLGFDPYSTLQNQNSTFHPEGANSVRNHEVPTKGFDGGNISRFAANMMGAKAIPDDVIPVIEQLVADGKMTYGNTLTNRKVLDRTESVIRAKGFDGAVEKLRTDVKRGKMGVDTIALGTELLVNAANAGDTKAIAELSMIMQGLSTNAGRAMQFFTVFRKLDPTSQLYGIRKVVDQLNESIKTTKPKLRKRGGVENVPVEKWMEEIGNQLAKKLESSGKTKDSVKPLTRTILADLKKYANDFVPAKTSSGTKRTEADRLYDLMNNHRQYTEAWNAAKAKVAETYKNDPAALAAFDLWLNEDVTSAFFSNALDSKVQIPDELVQKFLAQTDQDGRDAVMEEIYQNVADQVPSTWQDKWNAWRYMSMLSSPKTHIRNVAGNAGFQPVRVVKNEIAALLEKAFGVQEKTKSFAVNPAMYRAAWNDYSNVKDVLSGDRYMGVKGEVEKRVKVFKTKDGKVIEPLEKAREGIGKALEMEDVLFKRITYADSLAGYLQANGVRPEQLDAGTVDAGLLSRARDYAATEALRATYQDSNAIAQKTQEVVGALGVVGDALMPFKRTPANVLARAFEYSPAGLAKSLLVDMRKVKNGEMSISAALDGVAEGVTGTGLFALGAYLFAKGLVTAGMGDDEEDKWNELLGHQGYAIELDGGTSVTLDWLAPESLPFFMGVEFMSAIGENGWAPANVLNSLFDATKAAVDPMLELSMLQGVNDLIESVQYADEKPIKAMIPSLVVSYLTQAIPAVLGQAERSAEDVRMTTYTDKNKPLHKDVQYALGKASAKLPGWDYQQIPYIDAWGRAESTGDPLERAANNLFNPAYMSEVDVDNVETELQRLYDAVGTEYGNPFPQRADKSFDFSYEIGDPKNPTTVSETKNLSADEYVKYAKAKGDNSYRFVQQAMQSPEYKSMNNAEKAEFVADMYGYANYKAKKSIESRYKNNTYDAYAEAEAQRIAPTEYSLYRLGVKDIKADKDKNGESIPGSKKEKVIAHIDSLNLSPTEKDWLFLLDYKSKDERTNLKNLRQLPWNQ